MEKPHQLQDLAQKRGDAFWRGLEELAQDGQVQDYIKHEFPQAGSFWDVPMTRRTFLKFMGAQLLMLCLAGCERQLPGKIVPYVKPPEGLVPGRPLFFASVLSSGTAARGVLVESHMGRPTKIEGNPQHPDSLGATDAITQALLYQLYDPDRSGSILESGAPSAWGPFRQALEARLGPLEKSRGEGLRFLSAPVISPVIAQQRREILKRFPQARWHQYSPLHRDIERQASMDLYGRPLQPVYRLQDADVIVSFESDFLAQGPGAVAYAQAFSRRRRIEQGPLNRLYALESTPTLTGAMADHRVVLHPAQLQAFAAGLCERFGVPAAAAGDFIPLHIRGKLDAMARDLDTHRGRSLIVAGPQQPVVMHLMAAHLNQALGNSGKSVSCIPSIEEFPEDACGSLRQLVEDLNSGSVSDLIVMGANPVYAAPYDLRFAQAFAKADFRVHMGLYADETARNSTWHIPLAHDLESWGDAKAFDGTVSIRQPLIAPVFGGVSDLELTDVFLGLDRPPLEALRRHWQNALDRPDFDFYWDKTLQDGVMSDTAAGLLSPVPKAADWAALRSRSEARPALLIRPDPHILDGELANSGLLQELPKPLTRLTWDNAALLAPATAAALGVANGQVVQISWDKNSLEAPVWILPGQAPDVVTVHLGYGRTQAGTIGSGHGFNAYRLQHSAHPHQLDGIAVEATARFAPLATTQLHGILDSQRHPVVAADAEAFYRDPSLIERLNRRPGRKETLYEPAEHLHGQYQWGMLIDLNRCLGCGACTMACQVENNIPIVGKEQVEKHREMHWIRVDRYYQGPLDAPQVHHQPVPCMHCENAPCEVVCPVGATTHSEEGLNEMTYNRCIGTRYCSNNCPYKVRRFNFYEFAKPQKDTSLHLAQNPDVTVRSRGVMEKCTYCVQRINKGRIDAKKEERAIKDGEIVPACQQACPAQAIVFGNVADPHSAVSRAKASKLNYGLLDELGTRPRTTYLAKITNPNPSMGGF